MRIILLGTGTPILDLARQQSALLIEVGDEKLLFDVGRAAIVQLRLAGIQPQQVSCVFITHHHYDHICGLGDFLLTSWHNGGLTRLNIYGPRGTAQIVDALFRHVYARDIAFTLFNVPDAADIGDLVQVTEVSSGWTQDHGSWKVFAEYVEHGNNLGLSYEDWPCLGYRLMADGKAIAISGDTIACDGLDRLAQDADTLIQCCYLAEDEVTTPDFERLARYVIASSGQVGKIATRNRVKRLVLTHIRPKSEDMLRSIVADVRKDFSGELIVGEDLMIFEV